MCVCVCVCVCVYHDAKKYFIASSEFEFVCGFITVGVLSDWGCMFLLRARQIGRLNRDVGDDLRGIPVNASGLRRVFVASGN